MVLLVGGGSLPRCGRWQGLMLLVLGTVTAAGCDASTRSATPRDSVGEIGARVPHSKPIGQPHDRLPAEDGSAVADELAAAGPDELSAEPPADRTAEQAAGADPGSEASSAAAGKSTPKVAGGRGDDWPRFRGPTGMGTSEATGLPLTWSREENLAWKQPLPGPGASSPIVIGDRIYLTCYSGYFVPGGPEGALEDLKRHLLALRRSDGELLWERVVPAVLPEEDRIRDHGYAASTPVADADRVYVFFGKSGVLAFDHQGQQLWRADVGSKTSGWGSAASPILHGDLLIVNASVESESLVALDRRTGEEIWRAGEIRESWNTPLVVTSAQGREELVVARAGDLLAFDPATGEPLWTCKTDIRWYMVPSVVAAEGIVYSLGGRSGIAALAVRTGGRGEVTATHRLWTTETGTNVTSPIYFDGHLYWMQDQRGIAFCAKAATGEVVYEQRLDRAGQVYASALLADGRLYYTTRDGKTYVLAARPQFEQLAVNDLGDGGVFNGSPAVAGDRLLIRSDKYLYCIHP